MENDTYTGKLNVHLKPFNTLYVFKIETCRMVKGKVEHMIQKT